MLSQFLVGLTTYTVCRIYILIWLHFIILLPNFVFLFLICTCNYYVKLLESLSRVATVVNCEQFNLPNRENLSKVYFLGVVLLLCRKFVSLV